MSYIIDRDGKVVDAWYGYEEGHRRAIAALQKMGGELAEAIRREGTAKTTQPFKEVTAAAERLSNAIRSVYSDWIGAGDKEKSPAKDVENNVDHK